MNKFYLALLSILCVSGLNAQTSPGGVSANLSMWLRADAASTLSPSTGSLNSWNYFNNGNAFTATTGSQPTVAPSTFNFLPSIAFNGTQMMVGPTGPGSTGAPIPAGSFAYSIFGVWSSTTPIGGANQRVWAQRANAGTAGDNNFDGAAIWVYASQGGTSGPQYGDQPEISPFVTGLGLSYSPGTQYISQLNLLAQNTNDLELVDQTNLATAPVVVSTDPTGQAMAVGHRDITDAGNFLGARSTAIDEPFFGNLAELIVYSGPVSGAARNQVFSYLSMKYGIPTKTNLVSSANATVWDMTAGGGAYNTNVFGIGQDNGSGLLNTQSNSNATGSGNGTGMAGAGNIVLSGPASLSDQNFLMIGSNNAGFAETTTNLPLLAGAGSQRLAAQWLVQNTGNVGTVNVNFDFTGIATTGTIGTPADFRLVVDNTGTGTFSSGAIGFYTPTSFTGNVANFQGVNLSQSSKVVFAILSSAGAGTPLPVTWVNFTALAAGDDVNLNWTVAANEHAKAYEVEHSTDGTNFAKIGEVANVTNVMSYQFVHANAGNGTHYYRIHEVDLDGNAIYSKIVSVNITNAGDFSIQVRNNPAVGNTDPQLEIIPTKAGNATVELWTLSGNRVSTIVQAVNTGSNLIRIPLSGLASMSYVVKVTVNGTTHVTQLVKL